MRYMECWKNIILLIVNNQKNPNRAVLWRRKQQKTGRIDRRDIRKLALHSIPFRQWTTQRARYRKQVIGDRGKRSQAARLQICFCGYFFFSSSDILQETWVSGGFHPWGISVYRKKYYYTKICFDLYSSSAWSRQCMPSTAPSPLRRCRFVSCLELPHSARPSLFVSFVGSKMPIFKRRNRIF